MLTSRPRGTEDIIYPVSGQWQALERTAHEICRRYAYEEIRTPLFEHTELFARGVGESSDVVSKEMYTFEDRGGRSLTLRPEGTAGVVRAFLEDSMYSRSLPVKMFYLGPMFRYGRPQAGRLRQFHQFGVELLGTRQATADAEVIDLAMRFLTEVGLNGLELHLNSIGCPQCRAEHREKLLAFLEPKRELLCGDCGARYRRNPLRVFDCKEQRCQELLIEAPLITPHLCSGCAVHFREVKDALSELGVIFQEDPRLVRGLDYYTNTAFEIMVPGIGAQSSVGGGGRYDGLVELCGGPSTPAVGFAIGMDRVLLALREQGRSPVIPGSGRVFVAVAGVPALQAAKLVARLRREGFTADMDYQGRSLKAQMKQANRWHAEIVLILGEEELAGDLVTLRCMRTALQETVPLPMLREKLRQMLV